MKKILFTFCLLSLLLFPVACTYDQMMEEETCDLPLEISLISQTASSCGIPSGEVTVAVTGADAGTPLTFSVNDGTPQEAPTFTELAAGAYRITATQGLCQATLDVTIENDAGLNATAEAMPSDCGATSGAIAITAAGGSGQVTYSLNGAPGQTASVFTGLAPGTYQITAEDEIGCRVSLEATILSDVSFTEVEAIVTASCAVSGCHAGNISPDFRERGNILSRAGRIGARTGNGTMPPPSSGNSLSQTEIDAIACWIADGAPE